MYNEELRDAERQLEELKEEILTRDSKRHEYEESIFKSKEIQKNRELKLRKFKARVVGAVAVATIATGTLFGYKQGQKNIPNEITKESSIETYDIQNAPDEIIVAWADYAYGKFCDDFDRINPTISEENKNAVYMSYYVPLIQVYNQYIETIGDPNLEKQNESYHELFRKSAIMLEKNLGEKYYFRNTPFKSSLVEDDEVLIPYNNVINDSRVPNDSKVVEIEGNSMLYVPVSYLYSNNDNIKRSK